MKIPLHNFALGLSASTAKRRSLLRPREDVNFIRSFPVRPFFFFDRMTTMTTADWGIHRDTGDSLIGGGGTEFPTSECHQQLRGDFRRRMMALLRFGTDGEECGDGIGGRGSSFKNARKKRSNLSFRGGTMTGGGERKVDVRREEDNGGGGSGEKACIECQTTTTPLWRSGPTGPKTLCNACGIRRRRRRKTVNRIVTRKVDMNRHNVRKLSPTSLEDTEILKQKQRKQEAQWFLLQQSRKLASTCGKEEAEAAVLLMALSAGHFVCS